MPRKAKVHLLDERVKQIAEDPRYKHLTWYFPRRHPIALHHGPGVYVLANPKRRRAYVTSSAGDTSNAAVQLMAKFRRYLRIQGGDAHYGPKPGALDINDGSLDLPSQLIADWDKDTPESFTWHLVAPLPERYWFDHQINAARDRSRLLSRIKRRVGEALLNRGWDLYSAPAQRGITQPGARLAYLEKKRAIEADIDEARRNHLDWLSLTADGSPGLKGGVDPLNRDVQRAYARYQNLHGIVLKPGDSMIGHKSSDHYVFLLDEDELTLNCPSWCVRRPENAPRWDETTQRTLEPLNAAEIDAHRV